MPKLEIFANMYNLRILYNLDFVPVAKKHFYKYVSDPVTQTFTLWILYRNDHYAVAILVNIRRIGHFVPIVCGIIG
ncbi:Uncharacterised protein [uncultured archaeon]|nr:Uncharacterised protein [uncultured archaeon]